MDVQHAALGPQNAQGHAPRSLRAGYEAKVDVVRHSPVRGARGCSDACGGGGVVAWMNGAALGDTVGDEVAIERCQRVLVPLARVQVARFGVHQVRQSKVTNPSIEVDHSLARAAEVGDSGLFGAVAARKHGARHVEAVGDAIFALHRPAVGAILWPH